MSISRTLVIVGGLCAQILFGCALDEELDELEPAPMFDRSAASTCSARVQIARDERVTSCTDVDAWLGERMFGTGTPWLANVDLAPVPGALGKYCQYTFSGPGVPSGAQITTLYDQIELEGGVVGPSCLAVVEQGDALTNALGPTLREIFRVGAGRPSPSDLGLPAQAVPEPEVTVLVVDTQSSALAVEPFSEHGRTMGKIIADIGCPDDTLGCGVELLYAVGLPRIGGGVAQYVQGGAVGTHADVGLAIYEGVRRWEQANAGRVTQSHLVINLSVGWEPDIFGGNEDEPTAAIEAVRSALEHAACKGALVIASAGNPGDYCDVSGPTQPGGWETRPAPSAARCSELGVVLTEPPAGSYQPLVHAVGGLGIDLGPMPNARADANPRLLAASSHAVTGPPLRGGLTGTSVGTAATSAAAALVWRYRPDLEAHEVMDLLYANGVSVPGATTNFALEGTTPAAPVRVDACAVLDDACSDPAVSCSALPLGCLTSVAPPMSDLSTALAKLTPSLALQLSLPAIDASCDDSCGNPVEIHVASGKTANCGALEVDPAEHLVNPTPDSIGCPTCTIDSGVLALALHPTFENAAIQGVLVTLTDDQGNVRRSELGPLDLSSIAYTMITLSTNELPPGPVRSGEVTIDYVSRRTTSDPLLVL